MVKGNRILKRLGKEKFCAWLQKYGSKFKINLQDADLRYVNLRYVNLQGANLQGSDLQDADLQDADLRYVNLRYVNLQGANLQGANLQGSDLQDADLRYVNLRYVNLDFSCWPLHCGSKDIKTGERIAKQIGAHMMNAIRKYWPGELTKEQIDWLNDFHRIKSNEFPKFE